MNIRRAISFLVLLTLITPQVSLGATAERPERVFAVPVAAAEAPAAATAQAPAAVPAETVRVPISETIRTRIWWFGYYLRHPRTVLRNVADRSRHIYHNHPRKLSLLAVIVVGAGALLLGRSYYHSSRRRSPQRAKKKYLIGTNSLELPQ